MILVFYVYLLIAIDSVFCFEYNIIYENNDLKIINTAEDYTLILCEGKWIDKITLPNRELPVKNDIRFKDCRMSNNFKISKFMDDLKIKVDRLTIDDARSLAKYNLVGLDGLNYLTISLSRSTYIWDIEDDFTFDGLISLKLLNLSHDALNGLPSGSFKKLSNLENIHVHCKYQDGEPVILTNKLFKNLTSMKALAIESIGTKELTEDVFAKNFGMIQNLTISGYERDTLPVNIFNGTRNIKVLQITDNFLEYLPNNIFQNLRKLEVLDLSNNKLRKLYL